MSQHQHPDDEFDAEPVTEQYAVVADQPLSMHRPRRRLLLVVALIGVAIVASSWVSAYLGGQIGYRRAESHTDTRIRALEQDRQQRTDQRDRQNAALDKRIDRLTAAERRDVCAAIAHQRNDHGGPVEQLRHRYGCRYTPAPARSSETTGSGSQTGSHTAGSADRGGGSSAKGSSRGGRPPVAGGRGGSSPKPQPSPSPTGGSSGGSCLIKLPLLGCVL